MTAREALLDRCLEVLYANGIGDQSLREIASGAGTSHRMLIYHFGSRDGLLAAVVARVEADQRAALLALAEGDLADASRAFWRRLTDPSLAPAERLFFEIYVRALHGHKWTPSFRRAVIDAWEAPVMELLSRAHADPRQARAAARLAVAVTRGLLLDLLLTGDREIVDDARALFDRLFTANLTAG
jgi:AcrR family transcriptional regulator